MEKVKKQHFVPRFYLSRWIKDTSSGQLFVYNKERGKQYSANIKDVSSSKYFYDYPKLDEKQKAEFINKLKRDQSIPKEEQDNIINFIESQNIEKALETIETINAPILDSIIEKLKSFSALPLEYFHRYNIFSFNDIQELSLFIALQYARTPEMRFSIEHMLQALAKYTVDFSIDNLDIFKNDTALMQEVGEDNFKAFYESIQTKQFTKDSYTIEIDQNYIKIHHIVSLFKIAESLSQILINYKWFILVNKTSTPFFTSDHPVIKKANIDNPIYPNGFSSKGIEVFFPISPDYAISIFEPSFLYERIPSLLDMNILECSTENIIHYNDLLIQQATEQVYSNKEDFKWIIKRIKSNPEIANKYRKRIETN